MSNLYDYLTGTILNWPMILVVKSNAIKESTPILELLLGEIAIRKKE